MQNKIVVTVRLVIALLFVMFASFVKVQETEADANNVRLVNRKISRKIFKNDESYDQEKPFKTLTFDNRTSRCKTGRR